MESGGGSRRPETSAAMSVAAVSVRGPISLSLSLPLPPGDVRRNVRCRCVCSSPDFTLAPLSLSLPAALPSLLFSLSPCPCQRLHPFFPFFSLPPCPFSLLSPAPCKCRFLPFPSLLAPLPAALPSLVSPFSCPFSLLSPAPCKCRFLPSPSLSPLYIVTGN